MELSDTFLPIKNLKLLDGIDYVTRQERERPTLILDDYMAHKNNWVMSRFKYYLI